MPRPRALAARRTLPRCLVSTGLSRRWNPRSRALGISQLAGLVVVAITATRLERRRHPVRRARLAVSVVLNGALQVAVVLIPILILVSFAIGAPLHRRPAVLSDSRSLLGAWHGYDGDSRRTPYGRRCRVVGLYIIIAATSSVGFRPTR